MINIYQDKIDEAKAGLLHYQNKLKEAENQFNEKKEIEGIEKWLGYEFESSSGRTPEYQEFYRDIKKYIKSVLDKNLEIASWGDMHFEFSVFIKNKLTNKYVYVRCSDVRFFKDEWYNNLLIRTAKNDKDYTGGSNDWCKLLDINKKALILTI